MNSLPIIFMYSGQGSHYYQMGRLLYEQNKIFRHYLEEADEATGFSIIKYLYNENNKKGQPFLDLILSDLSILIIEYALSQLLRDTGIKPDMVLGASVGEFSAAIQAGILTLSDAIKLIIYQAESITKTAPEGGMIAILENVDVYKNQAYLNELSELAAINFNNNFVISALKENLKKIETELRKDKFVFQLLPVNYPFHSSYIDSAKNIFLKLKCELKNANMPLISCINGSIRNSVDQQHFWDIVRLPILFQSTIQRLESVSPAIYIDLGPSGTLANAVKYNILPSSLSKFYLIMDPFGNDINNLKKVNSCVLLI